MTNPNPSKTRRRIVAAAAATGALLGSAGIANAMSNEIASEPAAIAVAQTDDTTPVPDTDSTDGDRDERPARTEEQLTGDLADQVTAAALDAVPGGAIERVETDDDGATYEAHMTDADGNRVTVTFDENVALVEIIEGAGKGDHSGRGGDGHRGGGRDGEEALTGDIADQVTAAALAEVPGGTVDRVETDADGAAYEAHVTDADGNRVTVTFDENVAVVEVQQGH